MAKSAKLSCPDCELEAVLRDGQRVCPYCGEALTVDAETFAGADATRPRWIYQQRQGAPRGALR